MKKILWVLLAGLILAFIGLQFLLPLRGQWLDQGLSRWFSAQSGVAISLKGVEINRWDEIRFQTLRVAYPTANDGFVFLDGALDLRQLLGRPAGRQAMLLKARVLDTPRKFSGFNLPLISLGGSSEDRLRFSDVRILIQKNESKLLIRFLRMDSASVRLRGGYKTGEPGQIGKAHLLIGLAPDLSSRMPESLQKRLRRRDLRDELRLILSQGFISAEGAEGPFFKGSWQS